MLSSLKVLLVPDLFSWILGTWAKQIVLHGRRHQYYFFSTQMRSYYPREFESLVKMVDVVHVLTQHGMLNLPLPDKIARVGTIHHVVDWAELQPITQADAICYVSSEWQQYLQKRGVAPENLFPIRNGVDTDFFRPLLNQKEARTKLDINTDKFLVGFFSKYSSDHGGRKGIDTLVGALDQLNQREKDVGVVVTGPGWQPLVRALQATGLSIYYFPFLHEREMPLAYNALDAYLITARIEGGPVPLLEAMACGIPVVTTTVGVVPEVIEDGFNGLVIPKDSRKAAVEALLTLKNDQQFARQIADRGRETILSKWQWGQTLKDIDSLYDLAYQNRNRRVGVAIETGGQTISRNGSTSKGFPALINLDALHQRQAALLEDNLIWYNKLFEEGNTQAALKLSVETWKTNPWQPRAGYRLLKFAGRTTKRNLSLARPNHQANSSLVIPRGTLQKQAVAWISRMRSQKDTDFDFGLSLTNLTPTLLSHCFAILGLELFDALATFSPADRQRWIGQICRCYQPESGLFLEPALRPEDVSSQGHNLEYLNWQATFFALAALDALDGQPQELKMPFLESFKSSQYVQSWLEQRNWRDPWLESNNIMFITSFLIRTTERLQKANLIETIETIFNWLDEHQNPVTGYWDLGCGASLLNGMAGAFHFYFLYFYLGRPVKYPERIIESTLALQQPDGLFDPYGGGGACLDLDAVDILVKFSLLTDYRARDVKIALSRAFKAILANQNSDGGFCEAKRPAWRKSLKRQTIEAMGLEQLLLSNRPWQGRPVEYTSYSSWDRMRYRIDESDQWSTWFRPLVLALISERYPGEFITDIQWRFHTTPTLGWHDGKRMQQLREQFYG